MALDFLILYEHIGREFESITLLKLELEKRGYTAEIRQLLDKKEGRLFKQDKPKVLVASAMYDNKTMNNKNIRFFKYDWANSSSLTFNLSIPLYVADNFTKMKTAKTQITKLEWNRLNTERNLVTMVESYRNNMMASTEQVVSNTENVLQVEKAVLIAGKRNEVRKGTVLELNSSQVSLTQAQLTYNQSIYDYLFSQADLANIFVHVILVYK